MKIKAAFIIAVVLLLTAVTAYSYPVRFVDSAGRTIVVKEKPQRVVSLVPSVTEAIFAMGAGGCVTAVTSHNTWPPEAAKVKVMGGFFNPSVEAVDGEKPEIIFTSGIQNNIREALSGKYTLITLDADSVEGSFENLVTIGKIFDREKEAREIIRRNREELAHIEKKIARIPMEKRKRVMRIMGRGEVMTPGKGSFQNEFIRLAGGIPHDLEKTGNIVTVTEKEWNSFNPQVIYGCGGDKKVVTDILSGEGWNDAEAVKNSRYFSFPCDLTCRSSTHVGYFVSWLASNIYGDLFSQKENFVLKQRILGSRPVSIDLPYIKEANIVTSVVDDFKAKSLVIELNSEKTVVSTLEGERSGIRTVGNHYLPPQTWGLGHGSGLEELKEKVFGTLGKSTKDTSFLFTGADMDNLAVKRAEFRDMTVYAVATAGVRGNAVRMSRDTGSYYEPGTINVLVLPGMKLTPRAMTRAVIAATEAKTAALNDLDIRSSYIPSYRATGTGTDNIIVVEGEGTVIDNAGGHSKMGELIARAVHDAVQEAIFKQNGIFTERNVFHRLKERRISLSGIITGSDCDCAGGQREFAGSVEEVLLNDAYASFIHSAFAVSDGYEQGLVTDLTFFRSMAAHVAESIAGRPVQTMQDFVKSDEIPKVLKIALNAVINGAYVAGRGGE